jgi:hypothetical protein
MNSFIEPLNKTADKIQFGWKQEAPTGVSYYKLYVGQVPGTLTLLASNIGPQGSNEPGSYKKVTYDVTIEAVRTLLSIPATFSFANLLLYFAITYVNSAGAESSISDSTVVEVPPVGIYGKTMKEDPTMNRHIYGFSDELQRWIKTAATASGGLIVDTSDFYKANMITEYTRDSSGNVLTAKSYFGDRTTTGSPAKLTTYDYTGGFVSKMIISDATV